MDELTWEQVAHNAIGTTFQIKVVKSAGGDDPEANSEEASFLGRLTDVDGTYVEIQPFDLGRKPMRLRKEDFAPEGKVTITL